MSTLVVLAESLQHLYHGEPWLDVTFMEHLQDMTAEEASRRFNTSHNTWELVNHLIFWHQNVTRKLQGEKPEQDGDLPDFYFPENHGENNWQATLSRFEHSVSTMAEIIRNFPEEKLWANIPNTQHNAYYYIQGILQHAAYHMGQIVLLHRYAEKE